MGYPIDLHLTRIGRKRQRRRHAVVKVAAELARGPDGVDARLRERRCHRKLPFGPGGCKCHTLRRQQHHGQARALEQQVHRLKAHLEHHHADDVARRRVALVQRRRVVQPALLGVAANGRIHAGRALDGLLEIGAKREVQARGPFARRLMGHHGAVCRHDIHALHQKAPPRHGQAGQGFGVIWGQAAQRHVLEQRLAQPHQRHGPQHGATGGLRLQGVCRLLQQARAFG